MNYRVEITPSAEADIEAAYLYIRRDSPENAAKWRGNLYRVVGHLSLFPEGCGFALENDIVDFEVRQKLFGSYRVLFTIKGDRVIVMHVRHVARREMTADELSRPDAPR